MENFASLDTTQGGSENVTVNTDAKKEAKKKAKKEALKAMKEEFIQKVKTDPTYSERHCIWTNSISVVNSLGYSADGNLIVDKEETKKQNKRVLVSTSTIVGYAVKNIGDEAIPYVTEEFEAGEDGEYRGKEVSLVLNPGETIYLQKKYFTRLCAIPEISFKCADGKLVKGSAAVKANDTDALLESYHFAYSDKDKKVNGDDVKISVAEKVATEDGEGFKWVVKPEFEKAFGYLNNEVKASAKASKAKSPDFDGQDIAANYIHSLLNKTQM